jgi:hypothetical protein
MTKRSFVMTTTKLRDLPEPLEQSSNIHECKHAGKRGTTAINPFDESFENEVTDSRMREGDSKYGSSKPLFPLGRLLATPAALRLLSQSDIDLSLSRHSCGDWGELCDEDKKENDRSIRSDGRLLSAYSGQNGTRFWIITEADRSATTILLPEEY